ncbi:unnamed protein product [Cunninghamella echinulata]
MMRNIECEVIVLQPESEPIVTRDGEVIHRYLIADKSGVIIMNVWGETGELIKSGDIYELLERNDSKLRQGQLLLVLYKHGKVKRVGQDTLIFSEGPNFSEVDPTKINPLQQRHHQQQQHQTSSPLPLQQQQNRSLSISATINNIEQQHHQHHHHGYNRGSKKFGDFGRGGYNRRSDNTDDNSRDIRRKRPFDYQQQSTSADNEMKSRRKVEYNELA